MTSIARSVAASAAFALLCLGPASAEERPLIWEFSKSSDISYSARLGSRLPTGRPASLGTEIRMRGPDPEAFRNPVVLWGTVVLAERLATGSGRSTRLDGRIEGYSGQRRVSLNNTLSKSLPAFDAEVHQDYTFDYDPAGDRRLHARTTQSVRLSSPRIGTVLVMRASRADREEWRTSIGLEQPVRKSLKLTATVDDPVRADARRHVGASYHYRW